MSTSNAYRTTMQQQCAKTETASLTRHFFSNSSLDDISELLRIGNPNISRSADMIKTKKNKCFQTFYILSPNLANSSRLTIQWSKILLFELWGFFLGQVKFWWLWWLTSYTALCKKIPSSPLGPLFIPCFGPKQNWKFDANQFAWVLLGSRFTD